MRSTAQTLEDNKVMLTIDIREDELAPFVEKSITKISREVRFPGFRPGKTPRKVIEARVGQKAIRHDAIEEAIEGFYRQALLENGIDAISTPAVEIKEGEEAGDVKVDATVDIRPVVSVEGYGAIEIEVPSTIIDDADIEESLNSLREPYGSLEEVKRKSKAGDQVTVDLEVKNGDEIDETRSISDLGLTIGKAQVSKEIEKAATGAKAGDVVEVLGQEDGSTAHLTVKSVKQVVLPGLDDDFAQEVSEFETLAELKADISQQLLTMRKQLAQSVYRQQIIDKLIEVVEPKEIPESLLASQVEEELHQFSHTLERQGLTLRRYLDLTQQGEAQLITELQANAARSVYLDLALRALAVSEAIEVTDEDIDAEIETAKEGSENPGSVDEYFSQPERRSNLRTELLKKRAFDRLLTLITIKDAKGNVLTVADIDPDADVDVESEDGAAPLGEGE